MIIDAHTHVYPEKIVEKALAKLEAASGVKAATNGCRSGLSESMKGAGVDCSVLLPVATSPAQTESINVESAQTNASGGETGIFSFGAIHPENGNYKEILEGIKKRGMKGVKLHPDYQNTFFNDIRYKRIVDKATELSLYVAVHSGEDIGLPDPVHAEPAHILEVLEDTGSDRLILAHMGGWRMWDQVEELLVGRNVYFDTAFSLDFLPGVKGLLPRGRFEAIVRAHGADRIVFGTDSPWSGQRESVEWVRNTDLPDEDKEKIFSGNMRRILDLV